MTGFQEVYEQLVDKYGAEEAKRIFADVAYAAGKRIAQQQHEEKKVGHTDGTGKYVRESGRENPTAGES